MGVVGQTRYCDFRVLDNNNNPVTNLILSDFEINPSEMVPYPEYSTVTNVIIFERDDASCHDSLTLFNHNDGRYTLLYLPSTIGHDYVDIWVCPQQLSAPLTYLNGIRAINEDEIATPGGSGSFTSDSVQLFQDFGTPSALLITQVPDPEDYTLYVYYSSDWTAGNTDTLYSLGSSALEVNGDWVSMVTVATPATVHIILMNATTTVVAYPYFSVPNPV